MTPNDIPKLLKKHGGLRAIARAEGVTYDLVHRRYVRALQAGLVEPIRLGSKPHTAKKSLTTERVKALKPKRARFKRYILTSAQNNTRLHEGTWQNLNALAEFYGATIFVSTFLYARSTKWQRKLDKSKAAVEDGDVWYDPKIIPHINNERTEIAKGLVWCGELNISPTAARPLNRLEVYTGRASMIIPHPRHSMQPIATFDGDTKLNYTTGTVTLRNYIQRKEGFIAEFYHTYGAVIVEVDDDGHWWVRQLNADSEGTIQDWDVIAKDGEITTGNPIEALQPGDLHVEIMDPVAKEVVFGKGGMVDQLRPKFLFAHDLIDMGRRSHHNKKDPFAGLLAHVKGQESVKAAVGAVRDFLKEIKRDFMTTVVVPSNHDEHLDRWVNENNGLWDPVNATYWSWLANQKAEYIEAMGSKPNLLWLAVTMPHKGNFEKDFNVKFLDAGKGFVICDSPHGGIECGMHGDKGGNGARGALKSFANMGRRSNTGHDHVGGIDGGAFKAGTMTPMKIGYNDAAPSSWTQTLIVTYPSGKRTLVTIFKGKARA